jgi:hypothetical protein
MKLFVKSFVDHFVEQSPYKFQRAFRFTKNVKLLDSLSNSSFFHIRQWVACNENTTTETLQKLALSDGYWHRSFIIKHKNATETVKRLILMQTTKLRKNELSSARLFPDL